eukprot:75609_1
MGNTQSSYTQTTRIYSYVPKDLGSSNEKLTICVNSLSGVQKSVSKMQQLQNTNNLASIAKETISIKQNLDDTADYLKQKKKKEVDVQLVDNRSAYATITQNIKNRQATINKLQSDLASLRSEVTDYGNQISNLNEDIDRKRKSIKEKRDTAIGVGVGVGVASIFTFGISAAIGAGGIAATTAAVIILTKEMEGLEDDVRKIRDKKRECENDLSRKKNEINSNENKRTTLCNKKAKLECDLGQLDTLSTELGKFIVNIAQGKEKVELAGVQCKSLACAVDRLNTVYSAKKNALEEWLKDNKLTSYKEKFDKKVGALSYLSSKKLNNDEAITKFIANEIGEIKKLKAKKMFNCIKKYQAISTTKEKTTEKELWLCIENRVNELANSFETAKQKLTEININTPRAIEIPYTVETRNEVNEQKEEVDCK